MALTRKMLKAMGIEEEKIDQIIDAHTETVDALKQQRDDLKKDADKLPAIQQELDDLKRDSGEGGYKARFEKLQHDFDAYKNGITAKEAAAAKEKAARAYFESKGIPAKSMGLVIRGAKGEIESLELDGEKIKDASALDSLLDGDYKGLIGRAKKTGTETETPPDSSGNAKSRAEIYKKDDKGRYILSAAERQKALAESMASESE